MTRNARWSAARVVCLASVLGLAAGCDTTNLDGENVDSGLSQNTANAIENRYHDNGDGTIADVGTWVVWQQGEAPEALSWQHATNYCAWLSIDGQGFRLPTLSELKAVVDTRFNPTIDISMFPDTTAAQFWSSSTVSVGGSADFVWNVDFATGNEGANTPDTALRVRCVRGVQHVPD